jgi:hypothetical protein
VRRFRTLMYILFTIAGIFAFIYPTQVIMSAVQISLAYLWAGFLVAGGLSSGYGSLRGRLAGETIGIPLLAASSAIFGGALFGYGQTSASFSIGCVFWGLAFGLGARWLDVKNLVKISQEVSNGES